jgi:uracil-DNA glycosylase family 4
VKLADHNARIVECRACPRLVAWREKVSIDKRKSYAGDDYWGRPLPGFGDPKARLVIVGLAPAAHGGNRTGRVFTGDRSGDWLYRALHKAGFANQARSVGTGDGLKLRDCYVTVGVRCAPPDNKPLPIERETCRPHLQTDLQLLTRASVLLCLGKMAWEMVVAALEATGKRPRFGHGAEAKMNKYSLIGSYHPSQQNTFTGRLTEPMFDAVFTRAQELL